MILVDTSVLLDILKADPAWMFWSRRAFEDAASQDVVAINDIIFAELCSRYSVLNDAEEALAMLGVENCPIPRPALFYAGMPLLAIVSAAGRRQAYCPISLSEHMRRSRAQHC